MAFEVYHPIRVPGVPETEVVPRTFAAFGSGIPGSDLGWELRKGATVISVVSTLQSPGLECEWVVEFENVPVDTGYMLHFYRLSDNTSLGASDEFRVQQMSMYGMLNIHFPLENDNVAYRKSHLVTYGTTSSVIDIEYAPYKNFAPIRNPCVNNGSRFLIQFKNVNGAPGATVQLNLKNADTPKIKSIKLAAGYQSEGPPYSWPVLWCGIGIGAVVGFLVGAIVGYFIK